MITRFVPRLDILPPAQQRLWPELKATPRSFTLYGGTAIALRLGHRQSVDFDFFSSRSFQSAELLGGVGYLAGAVVRQSEANTFTCSIDRGGPVLLSYFGGLALGQVDDAELAEGPEIAVASLLDLAGMKVAVVTQRAEARDYLDVHALLTMGGIDLPLMLSAAQVIYGHQFSPLISVKALSYHDDFSLSELPKQVRGDLIAAVKSADLNNLPRLAGVRAWQGRP
jgi:Nucleotidyl transferase AbiEii toxin, Type IV TA system